MPKGFEFTLVLDEEFREKVLAYWIYRSVEMDEDDRRPLVDGVYIQRGLLGKRPPRQLSVKLGID